MDYDTRVENIICNWKDAKYVFAAINKMAALDNANDINLVDIDDFALYIWINRYSICC